MMKRRKVDPLCWPICFALARCCSSGGAGVVGGSAGRYGVQMLLDPGTRRAQHLLASVQSGDVPT